MKKLAALLLLFFSLRQARPQDFSAYQNGIFSGKESELKYRILFPASFDSSKKYPLIIFLHGAYEKGTDNEAQLRIGGLYFLKEENRRKFPAIVLFPQCPPNDLWTYFETDIDSATGLAKRWYFPFRKQPTQTTLLLKRLLDSLLTQKYADPTKVYIGGLSQGGMGVYDLITRYPDTFTAAFPICGAGPVNKCERFASKVAVWIFHGAADDIVPVRFSRDYFKKLQKKGADVRYSEYPGVFHNSWNNAFAEKDLLVWLFSKTKK